MNADGSVLGSAEDPPFRLGPPVPRQATASQTSRTSTGTGLFLAHIALPCESRWAPRLTGEVCLKSKHTFPCKPPLKPGPRDDPSYRPGLTSTPIRGPVVSHTAPGAGSPMPESRSTNCRPPTATPECSAPVLEPTNFKNSPARRPARRPHSVRTCSSRKTALPSRELVVLLWPIAERQVVIQADRPWETGGSSIFRLLCPTCDPNHRERQAHGASSHNLPLSAFLAHPESRDPRRRRDEFHLKADPPRHPKRALESPSLEAAAHERTETLRTIQPHAAHAPQPKPRPDLPRDPSHHMNTSPNSPASHVIIPHQPAIHPGRPTCQRRRQAPLAGRIVASGVAVGPSFPLQPPFLQDRTSLDPRLGENGRLKRSGHNMKRSQPRKASQAIPIQRRATQIIGKAFFPFLRQVLDVMMRSRKTAGL